jgi:ElaB/YqjD/DUF883 family membrane-anchored ribosome-binding protein
MNVETSRQTSNQGRSQPTTGFKDQVTDALDRGRSGIAESAETASDNLSRDVAKLREDLAQMQKTVSKFASDAGGEAYKAAQNVGSAVASQVGEVASTAKEQVKTFASEVETMTRRNPLGAIGATLLVGVVIGMMSRGRS